MADEFKDDAAERSADTDAAPCEASPANQRPLQVCRSAAGFYLGTKTATGEPNSREGSEYWRRQCDAEDALAGRRRWTQRGRR